MQETGTTEDDHSCAFLKPLRLLCRPVSQAGGTQAPGWSPSSIIGEIPRPHRWKQRFPKALGIVLASRIGMPMAASLSCHDDPTLDFLTSLTH